jgi:hypothetical protein
MNIHLVSMLRNDADIMPAFLEQGILLFDQISLIDIRSTDGTEKILRSYSKVHPKISIFSVEREEKFQSAMMNLFARRAYKEGADWIFFLDGDEFLDLNSRQELEDRLKNFPGQVMHLPWINLVPSEYGSFNSFNVRQNYQWSGRVSPFCKVALSSLYISLNPDFYIFEGNHNVGSDFNSPFKELNYGIPLLHIPIRSLERFNYKIVNAWRSLLAKPNRLPGEGHHVLQLKDMIDGGLITSVELDEIARSYGTQNNMTQAHANINFPSKNFPSYINVNTSFENLMLNISQTIHADSKVVWKNSSTLKESELTATLEGDIVKISPQPRLGSGVPFLGRFNTLSGSNPDLPALIDEKVLIKSMETCFSKIDHLTFSAWSNLVPTLFGLFAFLRPRRYVELGSHYGMSFFGACQAVNFLNLSTDCIAVDSWVGDLHASFHSNEVFESFERTMLESFPEQFYIKSMFEDALVSFDDSSIDLLHIDGYHTYEAVKNDFETWLPKMSKSGVIIFHDINVYERGFGVWRYWDELKNLYPHLALFHSHGLGILYVGESPSVISEALEKINSNPDIKSFIQIFLQSVGQLSVERLTYFSEVSQLKMAAKVPHVAAPISEQYPISDMPVLNVNDEILLDRWKNNARITWVKNYNRGIHRILKLLIRNSRMALLWDRWYYNFILKSNQFDANYYLDKNPDVLNAKMDPLKHFATYGVYELRNPNAHFDTRQYLLDNRDLLTNGMNPFVHYIMYR